MTPRYINIINAINESKTWKHGSEEQREGCCDVLPYPPIQSIIACRHYISLAILELHFNVFRLYITIWLWSGTHCCLMVLRRLLLFSSRTSWSLYWRPIRIAQRGNSWHNCLGGWSFPSRVSWKMVVSIPAERRSDVNPCAIVNDTTRFIHIPRNRWLYYIASSLSSGNMDA